MQLINVLNQEHIWSERYDRELKDVFAIQSDIAQCVAEALEIRLLAAEKEGIEKRGTRNLDAYTLYLKGQYFLAKRTADGFRRAEECYDRAIELDPDYALAYAGLADHYFMLPEYGVLDPRTALPRARVAAERALEIDSACTQALSTLAMLRSVQDWNRDL